MSSSSRNKLKKMDLMNRNPTFNKGVYICKGAKNGYWRLLLTAQPTEAVAEPAEEATVLQRSNMRRETV